MLIQTHFFMAKQIHKYITEKYQVDLPVDSLQYGSVKPDLHWRYINISHYYEEGQGHWLREVGTLLKDKKYKDSKEFSNQLGVVLHFTADFFCYAHNRKELKEDLWSHLKYELKLHQAFKEYLHSQRICLLKSVDINAQIKNLREIYLFSEHSLEKDIQFIYAASLLITDFMVESVLLPTVQVS